MTTKIRLLLVDDHSVMRAGLANMLNMVSDFEVVGEAGDGKSAIGLLATCRPDVVLLDVSMPGMSGIECLAELRAIDQDVNVLMLTSSEMDIDIVEALSHGARGYVFKSSQPTELIQAIHSAYDGNRVVSPEIERRLRLHSTLVKLTSRELEVLHLLRRGLSNPDIGQELGITSRTAKAHVASILEKLGALDRTQAVSIAFERGLLRP
jgi:DNA-binding NarL/FixJ family response regulator